MSKLRPHMRGTDERTAASPVELFFDLVFVFALTQVTEKMAADMSAQGLVRGVIVLGFLWWGWIGYAWLGNVIDTEHKGVRLWLFAAMASLMVMALAIPEASDDLPGGLNGPVVVVLAYLTFRLIHLALFWMASEQDPGLRRQLLKFLPTIVVSCSLLGVATTLDGAAQTVVWAAALAADCFGTYLGGASGWRIRSVRHFAERHQLILLIALGESMISMGVGVTGLPMSLPIVVAAVLGIALGAVLWWTYFERLAAGAEHHFSAAPEVKRARLARDAYSLLHFPLIAGLVMASLGLKKTLEYVGDASHHGLADSLSGPAAVALFGGVAVFLLGQAAVMKRLGGPAMRDRLVVGAATLALIALGLVVPALVALAVAVLAVSTLVAWEYRANTHHPVEVEGRG